MSLLTIFNSESGPPPNVTVTASTACSAAVSHKSIIATVRASTRAFLWMPKSIGLSTKVSSVVSASIVAARSFFATAKAVTTAYAISLPPARNILALAKTLATSVVSNNIGVIVPTITVPTTTSIIKSLSVVVRNSAFLYIAAASYVKQNLILTVQAVTDCVSGTKINIGVTQLASSPVAALCNFGHYLTVRANSTAIVAIARSLGLNVLNWTITRQMTAAQRNLLDTVLAVAVCNAFTTGGRALFSTVLATTIVGVTIGAVQLVAVVKRVGQLFGRIRSYRRGR